jgi:DTW domain-containing protein YfiP
MSAFPTRHHVLVLQHPQEPGEDRGTAKLAHELLPESTLRIGLSWPNLRVASGRDEASPSRWLVLYLGSGPKGKPTGRTLELVDKKGAVIAEPDALLRDLDGIVVLDGTWSQAKSLWWRNAWLLKCRRGVLVPKQPSLYGKLRREPRRECLSTIESIGVALTALGEPPEVETGLLDAFRAHLAVRRA